MVRKPRQRKVVTRYEVHDREGLAARVRVLEEALRPFANWGIAHAEGLAEDGYDDDRILTLSGRQPPIGSTIRSLHDLYGDIFYPIDEAAPITYGNLRRARQAIEGEP